MSVFSLIFSRPGDTLVLDLEHARRLARVHCASALILFPSLELATIPCAPPLVNSDTHEEGKGHAGRVDAVTPAPSSGQERLRQVSTGGAQPHAPCRAPLPDRPAPPCCATPLQVLPSRRGLMADAMLRRSAISSAPATGGRRQRAAPPQARQGCRLGGEFPMIKRSRATAAPSPQAGAQACAGGADRPRPWAAGAPEKGGLAAGSSLQQRSIKSRQPGAGSGGASPVMGAQHTAGPGHSAPGDAGAAAVQARPVRAAPGCPGHLPQHRTPPGRLTLPVGRPGHGRSQPLPRVGQPQH